MSRLAAVAVAALVAIPGCTTALPQPDRGPLLRRIVDSTVLLRAEREGGGRRSASGVVVAVDARTQRSWILTTRHFLQPAVPQQVWAVSPVRQGRVKATIAAVSEDVDLAILTMDGIPLIPATLRDGTRLGDEVWVVGFPFGRRLTIASGVVSQIAASDGEVAIEGAAQMVDAQASYGTSGSGVFDVSTGDLIAIVEGYRTARVTVKTVPEQTVEIPVPGGTTVLATPAIRWFLRAAGIAVE